MWWLLWPPQSSWPCGLAGRSPGATGLAWLRQARRAGRLGGRRPAGPLSPGRGDRAASGRPGRVPRPGAQRAAPGHGGPCGSRRDRPAATRPSVVIEVRGALSLCSGESLLTPCSWRGPVSTAVDCFWFPKRVGTTRAVRALVGYFKFRACKSKTSRHNRVWFRCLLCRFKLHFAFPPPFRMPCKFLSKAGRDVNEQRNHGQQAFSVSRTCPAGSQAASTGRCGCRCRHRLTFSPMSWLSSLLFGFPWRLLLK